MCEDVGYEDQKEGRCMTKKNCTQYAKKYPGYPCTDAFYNGNNCVCSYKEQPLCEDIGCDDQKEGRCMTKKNCTQYAKKYPGYTCNDKFCRDNDCGCSYKEQPFYKDIGRAYKKEGIYIYDKRGT